MWSFTYAQTHFRFVVPALSKSPFFTTWTSNAVILSYLVAMHIDKYNGSVCPGLQPLAWCITHGWPASALWMTNGPRGIAHDSIHHSHTALNAAQVGANTNLHPWMQILGYNLTRSLVYSACKSELWHFCTFWVETTEGLAISVDLKSFITICLVSQALDNIHPSLTASSNIPSNLTPTHFDLQSILCLHSSIFSIPTHSWEETPSDNYSVDGILHHDPG